MAPTHQKTRDPETPITFVSSVRAPRGASLDAQENTWFASTKPLNQRDSEVLDAQKKFLQSRASEVDLTGHSFNGYSVERMLGHGGMGAVCLARQQNLDRHVALKILPGQLAANPDFIARFTREALSAAKLVHHNIVQVHDIGTAAIPGVGPVRYISMEYVRGQSLRDILDARGAISPREAANYCLQAARGLLYAHEHGIVHRDIKPGNLLVNEVGLVKIADMGLAKAAIASSRELTPPPMPPEALARLRAMHGDLTPGEAAMGTPAYMAPEQARDAARVDGRADQYSLGCTLFQLCTGEYAVDVLPPHREERLHLLRERLPSDLAAIVGKMLESDPDRRYANMATVIRELETFMGSGGAPQGAAAVEDTIEEQARRALSREAAAFATAPALASTRLLSRTFVAIALLVALFLLAMKIWTAGLWFLAILCALPLVHSLLHEYLTNGSLYQKARTALLNARWQSQALILAVVLTSVAILALTGLLLPLALTFLASGVIAWCYELTAVRQLTRQQRGPVERALRVIERQRARGVEEDTLREYVASLDASDRGQHFIEEIFGYDGLRVVRQKRALTGQGGGHGYAQWREPLMRWLERVALRQRRRQEEQQLIRAETDRLLSLGFDEEEALRRGRLAAERILLDVAARNKRRPSTTRIRVKRQNAFLLPMDAFFRVLRLVSGVVILALYAILLDVLPLQLPLRSTEIFRLDGPSSIRFTFYLMAALAGAFLASTSFRRHVFIGPGLTFLGAFLTIFAQPMALLIDHSAIATGHVFGVGFAIAAVGTALTFISPAEQPSRAPVAGLYL
ncbi:MAG: serine/threonine-protein kinase [Sumerlaeia bacterium]